MARDRSKALQWSKDRKPIVSNRIGSPAPREGGEGDMQIRNSSIGAKLWAKMGGRWLSNILYGPNDNITFETAKDINLKATGNVNVDKSLKLSYDAANYADITTASDGHFEIATTGTDADLTLDSASSIMLETSSLYIYPSAAASQSFSFTMSGAPKLTINSQADGGDECSIEVGTAGATTIATVDDDGEGATLTFVIDGDCIVDRNCALTTAGTYTGLSIDFDKTGTSTSNNTLVGLNIDIDNLTATNGTNTMYGIYCTPTIAHAADAGTNKAIGGYFKASNSGANGTTQNVGVQIEQVAMADESFGLQITSNADVADYFAISTGAAGVTTISTVDSDAAVGHLNIEADGHVEFDNCAVGFDEINATFGDSDVIGGGNPTTDIDFRLGNKFHLELSLPILDGRHINFIFPDTSGNFLIAIGQDGTGSRTIHANSWKAYANDESLCDNTMFADGTDGAIRWAGGSAPTLTTTADKTDIISFYWDSDSQTCFAVVTQNF